MKCDKCLHRSVCSVYLTSKQNKLSVSQCSEYNSVFRIVVLSSVGFGIGVIIANILIRALS